MLFLAIRSREKNLQFYSCRGFVGKDRIATASVCRIFFCYIRCNLRFFGSEGSWGQPQGPNFPSPWATMLALRLDCSTAALTTPQKVLPIWKLVELKMLDFSDWTRTDISILTSAAYCNLRLFPTEPFTTSELDNISIDISRYYRKHFGRQISGLYNRERFGQDIGA